MKHLLRKHDYLISQERDFPSRVRPRSRYILCTSPRVGSTLLGEMLRDTGCAGDPLEYLNPRMIAAYGRRFRRQRINIVKYLDHLEALRTSPNGYFGIQLHFSHFNQYLGKVSGKTASEFTRRFDRVIFLRRRDRLAQAVSLHKSQFLEVYSSMDEQFMDEEDIDAVRKKGQPPFDPASIAHLLFKITRQDQGWRAIFENHSIAYREFYYEDIVMNWEDTCCRILDALDLDTSVDEIPAPKLRKQSEANDATVVELRRYFNGPRNG